MNKQPKKIFAFLLLGILSILYYFSWAFTQPLIPNTHAGMERIEKNMWWADDARQYRATGDWIFGKTQETYIESRPWGYPFFVGFFRAVFPRHAEKIIWFLQFLLWLASVELLALAVYRLTGKIWLTLLSSTLFWIHPSPIAMTFHGLTETLNIFLLTVFVLLVLQKGETKTYQALFVLALLVVVKPTYQIQLALLILYFLFTRLNPRKGKTWGMLALVLLPIWIQFLFSGIGTGRPTLSDIGKITLRDYFVTWTYAHAKNMDGRAANAIVRQWTLSEQLTFLKKNKRAALYTYFDDLIPRGLLADSWLIQGENNPMDTAARAVNAGDFALHLLVLPLMVYALVFTRGRVRETLLLLYLFALIQILVSGISSNQGDRLIVTAMPLWIPAYAFLLKNFPEED